MQQGKSCNKEDLLSGKGGEIGVFPDEESDLAVKDVFSTADERRQMCSCGVQIVRVDRQVAYRS